MFPKNSRFLFHVLSFVKKIKICISFKDVYSNKQLSLFQHFRPNSPPLNGWPHLSRQRVHAAAHNPERATLTLGLCHSVFTDQFIFRHIFGAIFSRENGICTTLWTHSKYKDIKNENVASLTEKAKVIFFRSVGFADWFVGLKGYSEFAPKPFWKETGP